MANNILKQVHFSNNYFVNKAAQKALEKYLEGKIIEQIGIHPVSSNISSLRQFVHAIDSILFLGIPVEKDNAPCAMPKIKWKNGHWELTIKYVGDTPDKDPVYRWNPSYGLNGCMEFCND